MSTLKTSAAQIGQSVTATNNFTLYQPATPDGTVRLGVGNAGSVTDILTINNSSNVGVGNTNPTSKLTVKDTLAITAPAGGQRLLMGNQDSGGTNRPAIISSGNATIQFGYGTSWSAADGGTFTEVGRFDSAGDFFVNAGYGSSARAYGCRAWINMSPAAGTIRASAGVSSISNVSSGVTNINFSFTMPDTNYCVVGGVNGANVANYGLMEVRNGGTESATTTGVRSFRTDNWALTYMNNVFIAVFR